MSDLYRYRCPACALVFAADLELHEVRYCPMCAYATPELAPAGTLVLCSDCGAAVDAVTKLTCANCLAPLCSECCRDGKDACNACSAGTAWLDLPVASDRPQ